MPSNEELWSLAHTWAAYLKVTGKVETLFSEFKEVRDRAREAALREALKMICPGCALHEPLAIEEGFPNFHISAKGEKHQCAQTKLRRVAEESHAKRD